MFIPLHLLFTLSYLNEIEEQYSVAQPGVAMGFVLEVMLYKFACIYFANRDCYVE